MLQDQREALGSEAGEGDQPQEGEGEEEEEEEGEEDIHGVVTTRGKERALGGSAPYGVSLIGAMSSPTGAANTYYLSCPAGRADKLNHELGSEGS